jgi:feruloyl esterase
VQAFAEVARVAGLYDEFGYPAVNKTFTDDDFVLVSDAVLEVCDTLDGLADGIVDNFPKCTPDLVGPKLEELICSGVKEPDCLSAPQVTALLKAQAGAKNSQGEQYFADRPWDAGIGGKVGDRYFSYWRGRKIGSYNSTANWRGPNVMAFLLEYDFDSDLQEILATAGPYSWSGLEAQTANSTELSVFRDRGSKLILVSGVSDPVILTNDLINWWEEVDRINDGTASDFVRLFAVPGGSHDTAIGPSAGQFDALSAIVNWVENGIAPDRIKGTAGNRSPWPGRTRPLCPYPQQARYEGSGSIEDASNFVCDTVRN